MWLGSSFGATSKMLTIGETELSSLSLRSKGSSGSVEGIRMPTHDVIDNRQEKLVDHINRILSSTEAARFAVGYFFLSGLESIAERLAGVKELRLLIGNTTNRETIEQIAEGYRRLDLVRDEAEAQAYPKRSEARQ